MQNKATVSNSNKLETMQAVVLVEFMSHFKANRTSEDLSEVFRAVYDKVCVFSIFALGIKG